jgi:hypothetical protein
MSILELIDAEYSLDLYRSRSYTRLEISYRLSPSGSAPMRRTEIDG